MADLQELFARLNGGASGNQQQQQQPSYQQPSVSSPLFSPQPTGPQPHHQSAIMSPNSSMANTPVPEQGHVSQQTPQQQSTNLLNLLRFNSQGGGQPRRQVSQHTTQVTDASDLMATVMGSRVTSQGGPAPAPAMPAAMPAQQNPQDLLLRLLNHPKPAQQASGRASRAASTVLSPPRVASNKPETVVDDLAQDLADAELEQVPSDAVDPTPAASASPMRVFGSDGQESASSRFQSEPTTLAPKFTYVNPFDQLEAASPRNRTPVQASKPPAPKVEILKKNAVEAPVPTAQEEAHTHETVAEAVSDLGEQVGQQIEEALAEAESAAHMAEELGDLPAEDIAEMQETMAEIATEIKADFADATTAKEIEAALPTPIADALKLVAAEVADDNVAENWETAEAEESMAKDDQTVIVYRFPMRAFASIQVNQMPPRRLYFANELFMDIARLKKDFDQIDRSLVSGSKNFIVYALVKKGGFRIIRQENGHYRQVFENHQERIFNIALCTAADESPGQQSLESVLGIGVNGTVFWASLDPAREDQFDDLDSQDLMLPPSPSQDDNTSGGQLKTRAKPSSRHPEFFAVGRGKSIHIVFPRVAAEYARPKSRICHTERYLKERSLKILTGKAGKDFTFSEDDTIIVSLDKAGRMRFWDIRTLTDPELGNPRSPPRQVEVSETLLEFHTTTPNAKSWPTSVFFFDKDKPYTKGIALRYVMVGMKQNHAFQLWDLGLNKAVQEIHLPHENESDAICSVSFHPRTGIMAVAHPTRNSIFFVHVSCPRYNLPVLSQAAYISRLANKGDKGQLPPVNATAIMTSITEYSFASKGQIRSLHMLNEPAGPADVDDPDNAALFELYVMHSKGVCVLRIRRSDLGWKKEGEPIHPKEAEEEGVITITQLKPPQPVTTDESSTAGDTPAPKSVSDRSASARETLKRESSNVSRQSLNPEAAMRASTLAKVESKQDAARAAIINGGDKPEKKKKKRPTAETASQVTTVSTSARAPPPAPPSYAQAAQATQQVRSPAPEALVIPEASKSAAINESGARRDSPKVEDTEAPEWAKQLISKHFQQQSVPSTAAAAFDAKKLEEVVQAEITKGFARELDVMYKRIDEDKRVMNAANGAKQEAILRMVSSTLNENVEGVIRKMVDDNIRNVLLPEVLAKTSATLEQGLSSNLQTVVSPMLSREVPEAVSRALKHPQMFQSLSDQVTKKIVGNLEPIVTASVGTVVNPAMSNLSSLIERQIGAELRQAHAHRREDAAKIAQLTDTVHTCLETIQTMVATQADLQAQIAKLHHAIEEREGPRGVSAPRGGQGSPQVTRTHSPVQKTPEELELEAIARLMSEGNYEQGTMMWLQSPRSSALFDSVFVRCDPSYLSQVSPLLALSTGAVVSDSLGRNLTERLMWLDAVLRSVNANVS
jgi:hypothetical protein